MQYELNSTTKAIEMNQEASPDCVPGGTINLSWFEFNQKNKPQANSVAGGILFVI